MLAAKFLAAMAFVLQASAAPGSRSSGLQLKRDECTDIYTTLVLNGDCTEGATECEFCCPDGYSVPADCHGGHAPNSCGAGSTEWHCDDH